MQTHTVAGGGDLPLHVREWGDPRHPDVLLIHGWSQSHLSWIRQFESDLVNELHIAALDLRGHGMSGKPLDLADYDNPGLWAEDIAAVIRELKLERPVLAGWSYGGLVISDYLRTHGEDAIAGVNFVGAATLLNEQAFGSLIGPGFLENFAEAGSPDMPTNIDAMIRFLHACFEVAPSSYDFDMALAYNMLVPPQIRLNLGSRDLDNTDVLRAMTKPALVTQGRADRVVLPAAADYINDNCPTATPSWYDGIGHAPFLEDPVRYNRELAKFVQSCNS